MKKIFVVLTMLAAMMLGMGTANATDGYAEKPEHSAPNLTEHPTPGPTEPVPTEYPDQGTHDPCDRASFCPDGPGISPVPTAEPAPVAPPVEPVPAPVEVQPVPAPVPMPVGTEERVAAGEELAYTGAEDAAITGIAASVLTGGVALVWLARRMRTA